MALSVEHNQKTLGGTPASGPRASGSILPLVVVAVLALMLAEFVLRALRLEGQWAPMLILGALVLCAAIVIGHIRRILLVAILIGIPFSININLMYHDEMAALNAIGGLYVSISTMALAALYVFWFLDAIARKESGPRFVNLLRSDAALCIYVVLVMVSALLAGNRLLGFFQVFILLQYFLLYIYLRHAIQTREDVTFVVTLLMIGMLLQAFIMFALPVLGDDVTIMSIRARIDDNGRVGGTVGGPNGAGAYLTLLLAPALGLVLSRVRRGHKLLGFLCVLFGGAALVLTLSRGAWMGFAVSALVFCTFALRRRWLHPAVILGLVVSIIGVGLVFQDLIVARLTGPDDGAAFARWPLMQIAAGMITDQPLLGVGANNFALYIDEYAVGPLAGEWLSTVHNRYLLLWAESGILALISYLVFLALTIHRGWRCYRFRDPVLSPITLGLVAGIVGLMVHMLVDILRSGPATELFFVTMALVACTDSLLRREALDRERLMAGEEATESEGEYVVR